MIQNNELWAWTYVNFNSIHYVKKKIESIDEAVSFNDSIFESTYYERDYDNHRATGLFICEKYKCFIYDGRIILKLER